MEKKLEWNVIWYDINSGELTTYNIFKHSKFLEYIKKDAKENYDKGLLPDYEKFKESVRRELQYYFWCKCEYEVIISAWPPNEKVPGKKIDVYSQVMMNFDIFYNYLYINLFGDCKQCEES